MFGRDAERSNVGGDWQRLCARDLGWAYTLALCFQRVPHKVPTDRFADAAAMVVAVRAAYLPAGWKQVVD